MSTRSIESDLRTITDAVNVAPRTVVAVPPDEDDAAAGTITVHAGGVVTVRAFDPDLSQP